ncbi:MAG: hypothetical protein QM723_38885 [Myxococcaceae bacterium]
MSETSDGPKSQYLFDANATRCLYDPRESASANFRLTASLIAENGGYTTAWVVVHEMIRGILVMAPRPPPRLLGPLDRLLRQAEVLGLDVNRWAVANQLFVESRRAGRTIQDRDLFVAATAFAHARTLVTLDAGLAENLRALGYAERVRHVGHDATR